MSIVRWDPMRDLRTLSRRLEHAMEQPLGAFAEMEPWGGMNLWPPVDIYEDREQLMVRAEMPGVELKDVELVLEDSSLTLRGERKLQREEKRENYQRIECSYGSFSRTFPLPATVDREKIKAEMKSGILEVHLPKREGAKGKVIPVRG